MHLPEPGSSLHGRCMLTTLRRRTGSRTERSEHLRARRRAPGAAHPEDELHDDGAGVALTRRTASRPRTPHNSDPPICQSPFVRHAGSAVSLPGRSHHPGSDPILTSCHGHID